MKRKMLSLMIAAIATMPVFVNAEEVDNTKFKSCITSTETKTCTLTENVTVSEQLDVAGNIKLDLNGHNITPSTNIEIKGGLLVILHGGTLTIEDSKGTGKFSTANNEKVYSPLQMTKKDQTDITKTAKLIINSGIFEGYYYVVTGNGNPDRINTEVVINGGKLSTTAKGGTAIYQPQVGKTIINGGEIKGATGIEIRSGELEVNGGTIIGTEKPVTVTPNGSGTTSIGAGIAIAQHTTKKDIKVVINDGTIQGYSALYESNPEKNSPEDIAKIKITVKGGNLETINEGTQVLYSENELITVEAGEFNGELSEEIKKPEGSNVYEVVDPETEETKYVVATEDELVGAPYEASEPISGEEYQKMLDETKEEDLPEGQKQAFTELKKILKGKTIASLHDIYYANFINGNYVVDSEQEELKEAVKVTVNIPENLEKVKEGYTRKYSVIRIHENKDKTLEVTELKATEKDGKITFETNKFSSYVLVYEDVKNTENPKTFDGINTYIILGTLSLIGAVAAVIVLKKQNA